MRIILIEIVYREVAKGTSVRIFDANGRLWKVKRKGNDYELLSNTRAVLKW